MKQILFLFSVLLLSPPIRGQELPKEGSRLNYRIVGFSDNTTSGKTCKLEIATGEIYSEDSFLIHRILVKNGPAEMIANVPFFGCSFTWRMTGKDAKNHIVNGSLHHFSTLASPRVDTVKRRLNILQHAVAYKSDFVTVESGGILYDMEGNPVWFIPETNSIDGFVGNLRFTPEGTVTFLFYNSAYEMDFNGNILWKSPNRDIVTGDTASENYYHHEFIKCTNGNYMVLGTEIMKCREVQGNDSNYIEVTPDLNAKDGYRLARFGVIIEYDQQGKVVWSWQTQQYLLGSDFNYFHPDDTTNRFEPHDNSFYFDEKQKVIYLGFRNLNRVIKIDYPGGAVTRTYGENFKPGAGSIGAALFCNQHGVCLTNEGYLGCFNNNSCTNRDSLPAIVLLREPRQAGGALEKVWEFECPVEDQVRRKFSRGGNLLELPGRAFFVCMGGNYSKLFIVNRNKKILWSALPEKLDQDNKWKPEHGYRGWIITRQYLESTIWKAEKNYR